MKDIIKYAEQNGYKGHLKYLPLVLQRRSLNDPSKILDSFQSDIFFDHEFLQAVFGDAWALQGANIVLQEPNKRKAYVKGYIERRIDGLKTQKENEDEAAKD